MAYVSLWTVWSAKRRKCTETAVAGVLLLTLTSQHIRGTSSGVLPLAETERAKQSDATMPNSERLVADRVFRGRLAKAGAATSGFLRYPAGNRPRAARGDRVDLERSYETASRPHVWIIEMLVGFGAVGTLIPLWFFSAVVRCMLTLAAEAEHPLRRAADPGLAAWILIILLRTAGHFGDRGCGLVLALIPAVPSLVCFHVGGPSPSRGNRQERVQDA